MTARFNAIIKIPAMIFDAGQTIGVCKNHGQMIAKLIRILFTCCILALTSVVAQAATINFDGRTVAGCSLSMTVYTCDASAFGASDDISIMQNYSVTGNVEGARVTLYQNSSISGNVAAATIDVLQNASIFGNVTAATVNVHENASIFGDVAASSSLNLQQNSNVEGNVTAPVVTLDKHAEISGSVSCTNGQTSTCRCQDANGQPITCPPPPSAAPHHILISHGGSALTCSPQTVTITACSNAACTSPHYSGGNAVVTLTPGGASFAIGPSGINNAASVRQTTVGSATLSAVSSPPASNASTCFNTSGNSTSCTMTVAAAGFLFSVPNHFSETTQTFNVSAVKQSDNSLACVPGFANVQKTVNFSCAYTNPTSETLPVRMGSNVPLSASTSSACSAGGANFSLNFDAAGVAPVSLVYADVGRLRLNATFVPTDSADAGLSMTGNSDFVVAPKSFAFSNIKQTAFPNLANPAAGNASGSKFVKAGEAFSATVTALNAIGNATPNFGKESSPEGASLGTMGYPTLVAPAGGANPPLSGTLGAFSGGAATATTLSWNEAGIIALAAKLSNTSGYLGTGLMASGNSGNIGRFIPDHFDTSITVNHGVPMACPTGRVCASPLGLFAYSRQPFDVTVSARNLAGGTTTNYDSTTGFARTTTLSAWDAPGSTATHNPPTTPAGSTLTNASLTTFVNGVGTIAPAYTFPAAHPATTNLAAPTDIYLRAQDTDNVSSARGTASVEGGVTVFGGRLQVGHNYGSELIAMPVTVTAQYWNGSNYLASTTDSISSFLRTDVVFANCTRNLRTDSACKAAVSVATPNSTVLGSGVGQFRLNAPGSGNNGSVDVTVSAPPWLPSTTGRMVFGIYKSPLIYLREVY